ncbi:hypothetical protein R1flu_002085 [Riccia fluitans]|uniref:Uncharacterized protein n=1 Tax=Riccia fluitans TaxID=41844 RepID=A0ABD1Y5A3_9MARC
MGYTAEFCSGQEMKSDHQVEELQKQVHFFSVEVEQYECMMRKHLKTLPEIKEINMSVFYLKEKATPMILNQAFNEAQVAISKLSKAWLHYLKSLSPDFVDDDDHYIGYYFTRKSHALYAVREDVNKSLFNYFEREDYSNIMYLGVKI